MKAFGDQIREARERSGVSLRRIAKRVGISPSYLSQIERGVAERPPSYKVINMIAHLLDLDSIDLSLAAGRLPDPVRDALLKDPKLVKRIYRGTLP